MWVTWKFEDYIRSRTVAEVSSHCFSDNSFVCVNSLRLLSCPVEEWNYKIIYICVCVCVCVSLFVKTHWQYTTRKLKHSHCSAFYLYLRGGGSSYFFKGLSVKWTKTFPNRFWSLLANFILPDVNSYSEGLPLFSAKEFLLTTTRWCFQSSI